jgi:hypothetical protein
MSKTDKVLSEWDEEEIYLPNVNAKGAPYRLNNNDANIIIMNSINSNNNSNNTSNKGVTCVTFLNLQATPTVWESIDK